jgi:hypothetical protein
LNEKPSTLLRAFACAALLGALFATPAGAAEWKSVELGHPEAHLNGVSCPAPNLCFAVGTTSTFTVSTSPAGGAADWVTTSRPQLGRADGDLRGIDCPSPALCVAIESSGAILTTTRAIDGASAWTTIQVPGSERLSDVSCPRVSRCVAVGDGGLVVTSSNPTAGAAAWSVGRIAPTLPLQRVSCSTVALSCVATAGSALVSTTDLTAGAGGWELEGAAAAGDALNGVDCLSDSFCAIGGFGEALTTTNPTGPLAAWTAAPVPTRFQLLGVDCLSAGRCVATSDNGEVFASSGPQGWLRGRFTGERSGGLYDVSCPSEELCVAVGETAQIASSTNPFAVPAGPGPGAGPARPRTVVFGKRNRRLRLKGGKERAGIRFHFTANGPFTGFQCKLDRGPFRRCKDPKSYALALGRHLFKVRAVGPGGVDRSPGRIRVRVIEAQTPQRGAGPARRGAARPLVIP